MRVASLFTPKGLDEPVVCRSARCVTTKAEMINGRVKWKAKNRRSVASLTEKSPQIHWTKSCPTYGMADKRLVITVAAQNLICPQTRTYPRKAVTITSKKITIPISQVPTIE